MGLKDNKSSEMSVSNAIGFRSKLPFKMMGSPCCRNQLSTVTASTRQRYAVQAVPTLIYSTFVRTQLGSCIRPFANSSRISVHP
jgi:hypothetical protein